MENPNVEKEEEDKQFAIIKGLAKEAYKLLDSHQFPKAEAKLKELLEKDPHNTYGNGRYGRSAFQEKRL